MREFSWLLISDLHLKTEYTTWDQDVVLRDLVRDLEQRAHDHPVIEFIVVSGDLADGGKPEQYVLVESFLNDLLGAVKLNRSDVYMVPGNHDIDRAIQELTFHGSRNQFTSASNVARFLSNPDERSSLLSRLQAFNEFESRFCENVDRCFTADRLAYMSRRLIDGLPLGIVGLNSALACGNDDDDRNIVVGDRPIIDIVEQIRRSDARLIIGILHHPPIWLRGFDRNTLKGRFLPSCDILHRGHLHEPDVKPIVTSPNSNCLVISAGASYVGRQFANSYSIISLNVAEACCKVTNYEYDSHSGAFGLADAQTHTIQLRGSLPGNLAGLTTALQLLGEPVQGLAPYLAAIIGKSLSEVPVILDSKIIFGAPVLLELGDPKFLKLTRGFLNVRNSLLAFPDETELEDRILANSDPIIEYATRLDELAAGDAEFEAAIQARIEQSVVLSGISSEEPTNNFIAALDQLADEGAWLDLEEIARRYQARANPSVGRAATQRLAQALAHSDDPKKQQESRSIADDLVNRDDATEADYELGFAISRNHGDQHRATQLLTEAMETFGELSPSFTRAAYAFTAESGNVDITKRLNELKGYAR